MNKVKKNITDSEEKFYNSQQVKDKLKISGCTLMHLRENGDIGFIKSGNAYLYFIEDVLSLMKS